jgi:hypothetical protein
MAFLDEYARATVASQPDPPRRVPLWPLLGRSYRSRVGAIAIGVAVLLGAPMIFASYLLVVGPLWQRLALAVLFTLFTIVFASAPAMRGLHLRSALRYGIRVEGEIVSADWTAPEFWPETVDAATHGITRGTRRVQHPAGVFEDSFISDSAWASKLTPGTKVKLLAHPERRRVLVDLGPSPEGNRSV